MRLTIEALKKLIKEEINLIKEEDDYQLAEGPKNMEEFFASGKEKPLSRVEKKHLLEDRKELIAAYKEIKNNLVPLMEKDPEWFAKNFFGDNFTDSDIQFIKNAPKETKKFDMEFSQYNPDPVHLKKIEDSIKFLRRTNSEFYDKYSKKRGTFSKLGSFVTGGGYRE